LPQPCWMVANLPAVKGAGFCGLDCQAANQCGSNPVSAAGLPKTGIFSVVSGDFRRIGLVLYEFRSPETRHRIVKARCWRAFLDVSGTIIPNARLPGCRPEPDATSWCAWLLSDEGARVHIKITHTDNPMSMAIPRAMRARKTLPIKRSWMPREFGRFLCQIDRSQR
jgi:hypothetical protein